MKKLIYIISCLLAFANVCQAQKNYASNASFENNTILINSSTDAGGVWYAELKGNAAGTIELADDPMYSYKVFHISPKSVSQREDVYLAQNIEGLEKRKYKVGFWAKLMHRNAILRVEVQAFGEEGGTLVKNKTLLASTEVERTLATFVPGNWIYYSFDLDLTEIDSELLESGRFLRFVCYFNTYNNNGTPAYKNPGTDPWDFYISGLDIKRDRASYMLDGSFDSWTSNWPIASQSWVTSATGDVCFDRSRGHRMDDFGLKFDARTNAIGTITGQAMSLPKGEANIFFWARTDGNSAAIKLSVPELGLTDVPYTITSDWKRYSLAIDNTSEKETASLVFKNETEGTFYFDEVSIEDVTYQDDEDRYNKFLVTTNVDDVETVGSLRYYVNLASDLDTIVIDNSVSSITLLSPLNITKSLNIYGEGATIQVANPSVSNYRLFIFGANSDLAQTIKINDLTLIGGNIGTSASGGIGIVYKNTSFFANNVIFRDGIAQYAGALHTDNATGTEIRLTNCSFLNNKSSSNAGAFYAKGTAIIENCVFEGNSIVSTGTGNGSAITTNGTTTIRKTVFKDNVAAGTGAYGAAVFNTASGVATIESSLFEGNKSTHASNGTGAFGCSGNDTKTAFINCTFWGNTGATSSTIYNRGGYVYLINSTVSGNLANTASAGAVFSYNATTTPIYTINSIFAYNFNTNEACDIALGGANSILSGKNNIISVLKGTGNNTLSNTISVSSTSTDLFSDYESISFASKILSVPSLSSAVASDKGIEISKNGVAYAAGSAGVFQGYAIPVVDQRGVDRLATPSIGAYEYFDTTTSIEQGEANTVDVYPNPFTDRIVIDGTKDLAIKILSLSGQVVYSTIVTDSSTTIVTDFLSEGVYILQIVDGDNIQNRKLIKQ